jgi:hypothetical protein
MKISMDIPQKLKIELLCDPEILFLGIYLKEHKSAYTRKDCTPMFIDALFTVAKIWNQSNCPSPDDWLKKMWCIT